MPARRKADPTTAEAPSFEQCLGELEAIIAAMENERFPLEELVASYEKGSLLLRRCEEILGAARERVQLINLRARLRNEPADAAETPTNSDSDSEPDDDDIRLF
ncbi:MAG: exodeoxyribonuclease VII small subunit [Verrucomicrobiota bacterium]